MDDRLRALGRAARAEVEADLDVDAELAAMSTLTPADLPIRQAADGGRGGRRGTTVWLAATAAATIALVGGIWLVGNDDAAIQTAEPEATAPTVTSVAPTTSPTDSTVSAASTTAPAPTTTVAAGEPVIPPGSIALGPDDLIARAVDGDVWWYPGALGDAPDERILLIDRDDPRQQPVEGGGPNYVDHVAGTFRGSLVYGDCCEPVSGNLFAITEPGAEADLWSSRTGTSERAELWGLGYEPRFEPGGTRVLASNWDIVQIVDLATGADQFLMTSDADISGLGAAWADDRIAVLGWSFDEGLVLSVRDTDDLTDEVERLVLAPPAEQVPSAGIVGSTDGSVTVSVRDDVLVLQLITIETDSWTVVDAPLDFDVSLTATAPHLGDGGNLMTWVDGGVGVVQRVGEEPFILDEGLAEVWIPEARGEPVLPAPLETTSPPTTSPPTTVPATTVPTTPAVAVPVVDWRDLPHESSSIANSCVRLSLNCTRVIHDADGTPISYDPNTRVLTRHGVPEASTTLPDSYGSWPSLLLAGPDDVVYVHLVTDEAAGALVALSLAEDDAGREIARWDGIEGTSSESELVATPDGLVRVDCCGLDPVRPAPDAEVVVPWVDRNGEETVAAAPWIRATVASELTIARSDTVPAGSREWTFQPPSEWLERVMPQVTPTFDGGFVAALPTALPEGPAITIARGWPGGAVEQVSITTNVVAVALDRSGRVLIGDGDAVWRVAPFPDRTARPADPVTIDVGAGTVTLPDLTGISADWLFDPVAFADAVRGPLAVNEQRTIDAEQQSDTEWLVTTTTSNFFDDSVFADRWALTLERGVDGRFAFVSGTWANSCQPGRGHQDFRADLCI